MFKTIFENNHFLVIDKPAGLTVHPARPGQTGTLIGEIIKKYPEIKEVGEDPLRPGIVHRLDKDTSGLMIIAKNNQAFGYLKKQFQQRKIVKKYLCLVHGQIKDDKGTIAKAISLSKKNRKKRSALLDNRAKSAWTEYRVVKRFSQYTLLKVLPKTGRTHQIRIHLASIGHPVAGDKQYKFKRQKDPKNLNRQFLHAQYLKFSSLNGKIMQFKTELPNDLKQVLDNLKTPQE